MHDKGKEGAFVYEDGSDFTLNRWARGQPNAKDAGTEGCVDDCVSINGAGNDGIEYGTVEASKFWDNHCCRLALLCGLLRHGVCKYTCLDAPRVVTR